MSKIPLKLLKPNEVIPVGLYCYDEIGYCPYLQFRKLSHRKWDLFLKTRSVPCGNTKAQYCSYLRQYLSIQDCVKDCGVNLGYDDD